MADRRIVISILGNASKLIKSTNKANSSLTKLRGVAIKAAAGIAIFNAAMVGGQAAVVLFAGLLATLPIALAGIGIAGALMDAKVQGAFKSLKSRASDTLKSIGKPLVEPLVRGAEALGRAFDAVAPYLTEISRAAAPLVDGFFAKVEAFADKVGPKLPGMFQNAIPAIKGFASLFGQIGGAIGRLFSGSSLGDGNVLRDLLTEGGRIVADFIDRVGQLVKVFGPALTTFASSFSGTIGKVFGGLLDVLTPIGSWLSANPALVRSLGAAFAALTVVIIATSAAMKVAGAAMLVYQGITKVISAATKVWTVVQWLLNAAFLANPITWVILGIVALIAIIVLLVKNWDKVKAAMSKLWGWIKGVFAAGWDWLKNKLSQAVQGFVRANARAWATVKRALATAIAWYVGLPGRILRAVGRFGSLLLSRGRDLVAGLSRGVVNRWESLRAWIGGIKDRVKSRIGNTARTLYSAGRDLLAGMIEGVKAMAGRLISSVTGPIGDAIGKAKGLLGINSPSKVFSEIGKFTMQGYADGVGKYAKTARSAVEGALDPAALSLSAPGAGGGATVNITIQATPGTDKVALGREVGKLLEAYVGAGGRIRMA